MSSSFCLQRFFRALVLYRTSQRRSLLKIAATAVFACLPLGSVSDAEIIEWVTVGDPGNTADTTGYGAVASTFRMMKFEFTNQQYADFLNSVDPSGINPHSVYNSSMGSDLHSGIAFTSGATSGSKYAVTSNMAEKPVNFVSWWDAARVSNWLMNGAASASSTETGAYTLNDATSGNAPAVNPGATYFVPTENQWYKAAYYKGGGTSAGYWSFATQFDANTLKVTASASGVGSAGNAGNFANYGNTATWNDVSSGQGNVTTVGSNGGPSAYGTFDMTGNAFEWNDLTGDGVSADRGRRGGNYSSGLFSSNSATRVTGVATLETAGIGFRLASTTPSGVPEIDPSSFGSALAMAMGSLAMLERRARRAFGRQTTV